MMPAASSSVTRAGGWKARPCSPRTAPPPGSPTRSRAILDGCADLDLGFTPATNLLQLRRLALAPGQAADVAVAWLDVAGGTLEVLFQRYERRSTATYFYAAPRFDYSAVLIVDATGFIHRYPGLWEVDPGLGRRAPGDPSAARAPVTAF
jgi:hypothetical protein